jgi:hypothetical protein
VKGIICKISKEKSIIWGNGIREKCQRISTTIKVAHVYQAQLSLLHHLPEYREVIGDISLTRRKI